MTVPTASVAARPANHASGCAWLPAVLPPITIARWPLTARDGIQYERGFDAALSNTVPLWTSDGVPGSATSYQRDPVRLPLAAAPEEFTPMLCAVQRWPSRICAANSRSSSASSCLLAPVPPACGTFTGCAVAGTVTATSSESVGDAPAGLVTVLTSSCPEVMLSTPTK